MRYAFCILLPLLLVGCQRLPAVSPVTVSDDWQRLEGQPGPGLVASRHPLIPDVPLPIGFKVLPERSQSGVEGDVRTVTHVYQGVGDVGEAARFYRRHLPAHGWTRLRLATAEQPDVTVHAVKGREALSVAIRKKNNVTTLLVEIRPR